MAIKLATWNINSVRLRMPIVRRFLEQAKPDVLCLQETKCRDSEFPVADFESLGYQHLAVNGQKGYHGVCIASRLPFTDVQCKEFCEKGDSRHISVTFAAGTVVGAPVTLHNFYVPAGGDEPDPMANPKFAHKLAFLEEMRDWVRSNDIGTENSIIVGDLNIAPLEADVWNHKALLKVVSHTPIEIEALDQIFTAGPWVDAIRHFVSANEKLYSWWSYRSPDWDAANKGRRLDHIWTSEKLKPKLKAVEIFREARGWDRPSDHVPVVLDLG